MEVDPDNQPGPSYPRKTNVVHIPDNTLSPIPQSVWNYRSLDTSSDPSICIDNGAHSWRAGFSTMEQPYIDRQNVIARYKERKAGRNTLLFGKDVEADANSRSNARYMFDGDLMIHGDLLECVLDFTFTHLGIDSSRIEQPIVMTEKLANPLFTRALTSEVIFELYQAPSVTYGIDSLFAFSRQKKTDGLAISLGHNSSTVIPVADGRGILSRAKRIPFGGSQASELLLRLAQLKYPGFPTKVNANQATFMMRETCYFSSDYESELSSLNDPESLAKMSTVVQFPFTVADTVEKSEAELTAAAERRKEQGKRLQEMQAKQRAEKLAVKMVELEEYKSIQEQKPKMKKADYLAAIVESTPFDTEAEFDSWIKKTEADIRKKQRKDLGEEPEVEEEPSFLLVEVPDAELNEEDLKEKRRQRLMKAGWDARVKLREEKRKEKARVDEEKRQEESFRATNPQAWSAQLREEQESVILRMQERKKKKAQLGDRKSLAAQNRMKSIAALAAEEKTGKKRKKGEDDDGFGRNDDDWAVYREIGGDEESDAEEDDQNQLDSIESRLLQFDPSFTESDTLEGKARAKNALINAFVRGGSEGRYDPEDVRQNHQLHLNVERIRVPETWFQPGMFGIDSAGLGEVAGWVLNGYEEEQRRRMMQCIYVTGGCASTPGLLSKLRNVLTPVLPFRAPLKIVTSLDPLKPQWEAWRGMAEWSTTEEAKAARVTKAEYEEFGAEWLKEHRWGNGKP